MQKFFNIIDQSGWTGILLFSVSFLAVCLFIELHEKRQELLFKNGKWVQQESKLSAKSFFLICTGIAILCLFFIIKFFVK